MKHLQILLSDEQYSSMQELVDEHDMTLADAARDIVNIWRNEKNSQD